MTRKSPNPVQASMASLNLSSAREREQARERPWERNEHPQPEKYSHSSAPCSSCFAPEDYTKPFMSFLTENPTVFHTVNYFAKSLESQGFSKLSEREVWNNKLEKGGKYYVERNGSSMVAFVVGKEYEPGNGAGIVAGHIDALTARLKPITKLPNKAGYVQLGVAPYAGGFNSTWWDRDLGIGGRVLIKDKTTGKIRTKLVKLDWPIARIPTLAPHFGAAANGPFDKETQMVPIIGLDNTETSDAEANSSNPILLGGNDSFVATQPGRLVKAIAKELGIDDYNDIVNWELELFDIQPAQLGGIDKEFIFAGRIDDKLCSFSAIEALLTSSSSQTAEMGGGSGSDSILKVVGLFDDEEIGSLLRQGAHGNLLPTVIERVGEAFSEHGFGANQLSRTYANSFLISSDVTHAVNPNFLSVSLKNHSPRLNIGVSIQADPNGHTTTDAISTALLMRIAEKAGSQLQVFQIRNGTPSGGTVGPMLSSKLGVRAIDAGLPQLSMHSIRATTGSLDPGLGVKLYAGFFDHFEEVDKEFV
ncbi:MAG: hypothetical protein M1812_000296 [Candelaria pacifica]|nr:MAG: hypothetical protein M1812_000296 [Candelaria pacifica]